MQLRANHLTISRMLLLPVPCYLLFGETQWHKLVALGAFTLLALTDWWDGKLARKQGPTVLGGLLDPIADKMFLAFTYLPLALLEGVEGSGVAILPVWVVAILFFRELSVTGMRSLAASHGVEFHTATLAKYKTAIQMGGSGFIFWNVIWQDSYVMTMVGNGALVAIALGMVIYRAARGRVVGPKIWTQLVIYSFAAVIAALLPLRLRLDVLVYGILIITVISGSQYAYRVFGGLAAKGWPAKVSDLVLSLLEAIAPVTIVALLAVRGVPLWAVIAMLTAELAQGGLADLVAAEGIQRRRWLAWLRSLAHLGLGVAGWVAAFQLPELSVPAIVTMAAAGVSAVSCAAMFVHHRKLYL